MVLPFYWVNVAANHICFNGYKLWFFKSFGPSSVADPCLGILRFSLKTVKNLVFFTVAVCATLITSNYAAILWTLVTFPIRFGSGQRATVIADIISFGGVVVSPWGSQVTMREVDLGQGGCQHLHPFFCILIIVSGIIVIQTHTKCLLYFQDSFDCGILGSHIIGSWVCCHGNVITLLISGEVIYYPFFNN